MQNNIRIIGVKLNARMVLFHTCSRTETFVTLINCVVDDTLLETMPDKDQYIDQGLLQFSNVIHLLDPLLHFSSYFVVNLFRSVMLGSEMSGVSFLKVNVR